MELPTFCSPTKKTCKESKKVILPTLAWNPCLFWSEPFLTEGRFPQKSLIFAGTKALPKFLPLSTGLGVSMHMDFNSPLPLLVPNIWDELCSALGQNYRREWARPGSLWSVTSALTLAHLVDTLPQVTVEKRTALCFSVLTFPRGRALWERYLISPKWVTVIPFFSNYPFSHPTF